MPRTPAMKNYIAILSIGFILSFTACSDNCEQTVTYTRAIAEYGDLASLRVDDINTAPRALLAPSRVFLSEDLMLISEVDKGIHVIDNSDPSSPSFINFLDIPGNREMNVSDGIIYADAYYDMLAIDISNPRQATIINRLELAFPVDFRDANGHALIDFHHERVTRTMTCEETIHDDQTIFVDFRGARIPESAVPTSFVSSGDQLGTVNRFAILNDHLFAVGFYNLYRFALDNGITETSGFVHGDRGMETIFPFEDRLFIGSQNAMNILDASDPTNVFPVGSFWHATSCDPVLPVTRDIAYVTLRGGDDCNGDVNTLNVVARNASSSYSAIQTIELPSPYAMLRVGNQLYVGEGTNGFRIFEIGNDWTLSEREHHPDITAFDMIPHPTRNDILLFAGPDGIFQFEISSEEYTLLSSITY